MNPHDRAVILDRQGRPTQGFPTLHIPLAGLGDGHPLGSFGRDVGVDQLPQRPLGLRLRQPFLRTGGALGPYVTLHPPAGRVVPEPRPDFLTGLEPLRYQRA